MTMKTTNFRFLPLCVLAAAVGAWGAAAEEGAAGFSPAAVLMYEEAAAALNRGDFEAAESSAEKALAFEPRFPDALVVKGDCRSRRGDPEGGKDLYREALVLLEEGVPALRIDASAIEERLEGKIPERAAPEAAKEPEAPSQPAPPPPPADGDRNTALLLWDAARTTLEAGQVETALTLAEKADQTDPSLPDAAVLLGDCRLRKGDAEGAEAWYRRALERLDQGGQPAEVTREEISKKIEESAKAAAGKKPAEPPNPKKPAPPARPASGDPETALLLCDSAREAFEKGAVDEALQLAEKARSASPDLPEASVLFGDFQSRLGDQEKALASYLLAEKSIQRGIAGKIQTEELEARIRQARAAVEETAAKFVGARDECARALQAFAARKEKEGWRSGPARVHDLIQRINGKETNTAEHPAKGGGIGLVDAMGVGGGAAGAWGWRDGGRRNAVAAGGGSPGSENAVEMGLKWLHGHQEGNGSWNCGKYGGTAKGAHDVAVTGLALAAFLSAGYTEDKVAGSDPEYKETVRKGLDWLQGQQKGGAFSNNNYAHGMATLAASEAFGMTQKRKEIVQIAINHMAAQQQAGGGWDYGDKPAKNRNDTSITGWQIGALHTAYAAGLNVPKVCLENAVRHFKSAAGGDLSSHSIIAYAIEDGHVQKGGLAIAAVSMASLLRLGYRSDEPYIRAGANAIRDAGPQVLEKMNLYYLYYATLTMFQIGGEYWTDWNAGMRAPLVQIQVKTPGDNLGSWDPQRDAYGMEGGRVYSTALAVLCLQAGPKEMREGKTEMVAVSKPPTAKTLALPDPAGSFLFPDPNPDKEPDPVSAGVWIKQAKTNPDPKAGMENVKKALRFDPENVEALSLASSLLEKNGDPDSAVEALKRAIRALRRDDPKARPEELEKRLRALDTFSPEWADLRREWLDRFEAAAEGIPEGRWRSACLTAAANLRALRLSEDEPDLPPPPSRSLSGDPTPEAPPPPPPAEGVLSLDAEGSAVVATVYSKDVTKSKESWDGSRYTTTMSAVAVKARLRFQGNPAAWKPRPTGGLKIIKQELDSRGRWGQSRTIPQAISTAMWDEAGVEANAYSRGIVHLSDGTFVIWIELHKGTSYPSDRVKFLVSFTDVKGTKHFENVELPIKGP